MTNAERKALARANGGVTAPRINPSTKGSDLQILAAVSAALAYGGGMWAEISKLCIGTARNTFENPLPEGTDIKSLPSNSLHYLQNFERVQLVLKYDNTWTYASIIGDADGDAVTSNTDKYELREVELTREYTLPDHVRDADGNLIVLEQGRRAVKAYAL